MALHVVDDDTLTAPHDDQAEVALLGAVMSDPRVLEDLHISGADFYQPRHEIVWNAIQDLRRTGKRPDTVTVQARLQELGLLGQAGQVLIDVAGVGVPASAGYYADIIRDRAIRRRLVDESRRTIQQALTAPTPAVDIVADTEARIGKLGPIDDETASTVLSLDEFLAQPIPESDWIIPGLLDRGDRVMVTGSEGAGKSILQRQFAVCAAAGVHPFTGEVVPKQRVLVVDCENPLKIMAEWYRRLKDSVAVHGQPVPDGGLWIDRKPQGLDVGKPDDRIYLRRLARLVRPDLLVIGPTYKLYVGGSQSREEDLARSVVSLLDEIREEVGCAVIIEHHTPHREAGAKVRSTRPIGSSLWLRWPEFGIGLQLVDDDNPEVRRVDVVHWRGPRAERDWPERLRSAGRSGMPWIQEMR